MSDVQKTLDVIATRYSSKEGFMSRLVQYGFKSISPYFSGKHCLELGPADGMMTGMLIEHFETVTSVDGSKEFCQSLKKEYGDFEKFSVVCQLFEEFEPPSQFDTTILAHVLEHLEDPIQVLKRVKSWVNKSGKLLIIVPNQNSIHRLAAVKMGLLSFPNELNALDHKVGHLRVYTKQLLLSHLESAGWNVEATGGIFFKPLSNAQIETGFSENMMDGFYELGKDFPENAAEIFAVSQLP